MLEAKETISTPHHNPKVAPIANADSFRVLSQNMDRLFDNIDDGNNEQVLPGNRFRQRVAGHQFRPLPLLVKPRKQLVNNGFTVNQPEAALGLSGKL